ncbi:hypothetical protein ACIQBJ_15175 [Kitasatospora sp. NPDC088391]|uniref:hypothetical protein n=1 Tax=Kitasatospora sp. NPDC088391 TaxID=3364074 RepID=UPI00380C4AA1
MTITATEAVPRPLPSFDLPLWLVTMPTTGTTGARGEQTFAVRAVTHAAALAAAEATAFAHPALRHRRGAHIDPSAAYVTLHH